MAENTQLHTEVWRDYTETIREAVDFPELVENTVGPLPRQPTNGRAVTILCPWHDDRKTKSLAVYADHAYCFGACDRRYDAFDWVMQRDNVDFATARDELARQHNIPKPRMTPEVEQAATEQRSYEDALTEVVSHFECQLWRTPSALEYARGRAWADETLRAEFVGYTDGSPLPSVPNGRASRMLDRLNRWAGEVGSAIIYAHREAGRIVYLSGRSIQGKAHFNPPVDLAGPKLPYLNSRFSQRVDAFVVVEGQADAITLAEWGTPAMALAGSSLTADFADRLTRLSDRGAEVYLVPDGDSRTDVQGAVTSVGPLLRVITLPDGVLDVNEYAQQGATRDDFHTLLADARPWLDVEAEQVAALDDAARADALRNLFRHVAKLDQFQLAVHKQTLVRTLGIGARVFDRLLKSSEEASAEENRGQHDDVRYVVVDGRICAVRYDRMGMRSVEPLCNFVAEIVEDVARDDGLEIDRQFSVLGQLEDGRVLPTARVDANRFNAMGWVSENWGVRAVVHAGFATRDRLREAIQLRSVDAPLRYFYTHTGWRVINGRRGYLSANGALGVNDVNVELDRELQRYRLPAVPENVADAVRASVNFLDVAPLTATAPLWSSVYLAPLIGIIYPAFVVWIYGVTGTLKSTLAALALSHYGDFSDKDLFAWTDTANRLEKNAFLTKDALVVIDDFAPTSDPYAARQLEGKAARIIRNVGNRSGRGRLTSTLSLRPVYRPRGLVVSTGEQVPTGQSVLARMYIVEMHPGDVDLTKLTIAQNLAKDYPHALAGYVLWLRDQWEALSQELPKVRQELRSRLLAEDTDLHLRIPDALTTLYLGLDVAMSYAEDIGAISRTEAEERRDSGWHALKAGAEAQARWVERERPTVRFFGVLSELLATGRVRLVSKGGDGAVGGDGDHFEHLGWYDDNFVYLLPESAYNRVARFLRSEGENISVKERTLRKHLAEEGYLVVHCAQEAGDTITRYTNVIRVGTATHRVLWLHRDRLESVMGSLSPTQ